MTEVSERYQRLADVFEAKIAAVPSDKWTAPTPCGDWTVRDLVGHVVNTQGMILGLVGRSVGDIPSADDDPQAAFAAARAVVQRDLEDPTVATLGFEGSMGAMTLEEAVNRFLCFDLVVHAWDLSHAAHLDENIDEADVARVQAQAASFGDAMRGPQAFGPALEPSAGADAQDRLLAFLGRKP
jgi:uncharacterized protein (TIGR03086 family)